MTNIKSVAYHGYIPREPPSARPVKKDSSLPISIEQTPISSSSKTLKQREIVPLDDVTDKMYLKVLGKVDFTEEEEMASEILGNGEIAKGVGFKSESTQIDPKGTLQRAIDKGAKIRVIEVDHTRPQPAEVTSEIVKIVEIEVDDTHKEADERRTPRKERLWIFIDTFGTVRNTVATTSTSIKMSGSVVAAAALPALTAVVGGMAAVGGLAIIFSALFDNLPDVKKEIEEAIDTNDAEKLYLATISIFTSVVFYGGFGVGLTGMGVSMLFTPDVASGLFHASYGTELAKTVATGFGDYFLGSLCIARGSLMGGRAIYNMTQLGGFDKGFYQALRNGTVGDFLRAEYDDHAGHFHRMAGNSEALKSWINEDMQGEPSRAVLEDIDKHLFRQQYIQKLVLIISILMIIGGICALCVGGGALVHLALLPLTLTTNIAGTLMEFYYCHYDRSSWLDRRIAKAYEESRRAQFEQAYGESSRNQMDEGEEISAQWLPTVEEEELFKEQLIKEYECSMAASQDETDS